MHRPLYVQTLPVLGFIREEDAREIESEHNPTCKFNHQPLSTMFEQFVKVSYLSVENYIMLPIYHTYIVEHQINCQKQFCTKDIQLQKR